MTKPNPTVLEPKKPKLRYFALTGAIIGTLPFFAIWALLVLYDPGMSLGRRALEADNSFTRFGLNSFFSGGLVGLISGGLTLVLIVALGLYTKLSWLPWIVAGVCSLLTAPVLAFILMYMFLMMGI